MDPMEAIKQTYFQECEELLLAMEEGLIAIQNGEAESESINSVFRAVHSIKGSGGAFGFEALVAFAHTFETVLDLLRSGKLTAEERVVEVMLRAGDILADHVKAARCGVPMAPERDRDVMAELAALSDTAIDGSAAEDDDDGMDGLSFAPMMVATEADAPADTGAWHINFMPHPALYAKANDPFLLLRELGSLGKVEVEADISRLAALDVLECDQSYIAWNIVLHGDVAQSSIEEVFDFVTGDCDLTITRVEPESIEQPAEPEPVMSAPVSESPAPVAPVAANEAAPPEKKEPAGESQVKQTIRVDLDKVERLVNLVGELVITQAMLHQRFNESQISGSSLIGNGLMELEQLLRELQESVMSIRTQPVKSVFQRMPRLVRELAAQTNKKVRLVVEGEATEVDKTVIERLGEPLTHMIRNAVDHGLENAEKRQAVGKPEEGTVTLSAEHRGGRIIIEVGDDGAGINRERVLQKAIERGLVAPQSTLSDEEVDNLIFLPGFSTASQVSNISGRGVGMDVVRRNIVDLGGRIVINSTPGKGSKFVLTLPLTLAVLDGMVVAVGDQTFVLPLAHIVESLKPRPQDIQPFSGRNLLNVRGSYVPLVHTGELLGVHDAVEPDQGVVILVESQGTGRLALVVDAILGQRQVVIKSFEDNYQHIDGVAAATILGDGRVALIIDVDGLVSRCRAELSANDWEHKATGS